MQEEIEFLSFDELNIGFGQELKLLPDPNDDTTIFDHTLVGYFENRSIILSPHYEEAMNHITEGQEVVIKIKMPTGIVVFPSEIIFIADAPTIMIYLDFPRNIKFKQIRQAQRVDIRLPILVTNKTSKGIMSEDGVIVDLSTSGAQISMSSSGGMQGDTLEIKGRFTLGTIRRTLTVQAIIRNVEAKGASYIYGLQFVNMDEDNLLLLFGFTFHAMANGTVHNIR